jgi:hypothetical protein
MSPRPRSACHRLSYIRRQCARLLWYMLRRHPFMLDSVTVGAAQSTVVAGTAVGDIMDMGTATGAMAAAVGMHTEAGTAKSRRSII